MAEGFIRFSHLGLSSKQLRDRQTAVKVNAAIDKKMRSIWQRAGAVFIETLSKEVLVQTGESFGSLVSAAAEVNLGLRLPTPKKLKHPRPQLDPATGAPIPGTVRSLASGLSRGRDTLKLQFKVGSYSFFFDFNVFQLALHDAGAGNAGPTSAAGAADRARRAAEKFARRTFQEEVGQIIDDWLTTGTVKSIEI